MLNAIFIIVMHFLENPCIFISIWSSFCRVLFFMAHQIVVGYSSDSLEFVNVNDDISLSLSSAGSNDPSVSSPLD
jgi:hypothetical protein